ncbi:MAG TPA: hypothetical protein VFS40_00405 [Gemmatimonadales bacterium]|nr:hypothetical protein [Gemmatimonadales bacterium]
MGVLVAGAGAGLALPTPANAQIADNSFLIEEAYNQESGVVQHISTFARADDGAWLYTFTQEWPLGGRTHQASYTIPLVHRPAGTGPGDVALNYRFQLVGGEARAQVAPRVSLVLPVGAVRHQRGAGGLGLQVHLPLSVALGRALVAHLNAGATLHPRARDAQGVGATTGALNLGASAVWLLRPRLNLLAEVVWVRGASVAGAGSRSWASEMLVSPGVRWALDFPGGLQVVPGLAYAIGVGPSRGADQVLAYLSFEHRFTR